MTDKFYKLARPNGWDFYTGCTINYRENIGRVVHAGNASIAPELCSSSVLHASRNINDCFVGAKIPCSVYVVSGKPACEDDCKAGFTELRIECELLEPVLNDTFGWNYSEAINPINPFQLVAPKELPLELLRSWAAVWNSVWNSVEYSVGDSVWDSIYSSVWDSVRYSVWYSVGDSVWNSIYSSVWDSVYSSIGVSVWDPIRAYTRSLFEIKNYKFQSGADLWRMGFVPSFDGTLWRLHTGPKANVVWEGILSELEKA